MSACPPSLLTSRQPEGIWFAPGRVNLMGGPDYNEVFVLPFALGAGVYVAASRWRDGRIALRVSRHQLADRAAALRPATGEGADPVVAATKTALRILGRRVLALDEEKARIDALLTTLVAQTAPQLLAVLGVGIDTAAALLVTAGDNPGRLRSEAAERPDRGGLSVPGLVCPPV